MNSEFKKKFKIGTYILLSAVCLFILWQIYIPKSQNKGQMVVYIVQKGLGDEDIARELEKQGIIRSGSFFKLYVVVSGQHSKLQSGRYNLSSSMSVASIVKKFVSGDVIKDKITILEGWDVKDIGKYFESKNLYSQKDFLDLIKKDWSQDFDILKDKPRSLDLEGYIFPDTYEISLGGNLKDLLENILANFDKKLTPELRKEIFSQNKSIFEIITMASIVEKEVKSLDDKKIVSGILWKRMENNMPLQVDSTVNYVTNKNDSRVAIKDTKIDSQYNTYKYSGLPLGPISNPGMGSILAVIYPKKSDYWYYLSADHTGKTVFSRTLQEHNNAVAKYLE